MTNSRYLTFMDKLDRWTKLLGTVLVKVSFVNDDGELVKKTESGNVQLDMLHGGVYDIKTGASPYHISNLMIGFGYKFSGFSGNNNPLASISGVSTSVHEQVGQQVGYQKLGKVDAIFWSPKEHRIQDEKGDHYSTPNPYGTIPAVPFFNHDPAHYYFLPINEPLIYANHALNMRITDLNHIAKFQSFGVPVVTGVERPTSLRQGRPVDDFNILKGGSAQSQFGGLSGLGMGSGGHFRSFDSGMGITRDGNADANALGMSIGPDSVIAMGETGDFKFAHPSADITGLIKTIESLSDMVRVSHGLRPKFKDKLPSSGFALMMEKIGVMEDNLRRAKLFREREQQLFQVVKRLWNIHHSKSGEKKFNEKCRLDVIYKDPSFPVDPKTKMESIAMENNLLDTGDVETYRKIYSHYNEADIRKFIKKRRKDREEQVRFETELVIQQARMAEEAGFDPGLILGGKTQSIKEDKIKIKDSDNKAKQSEDSSKQNGKNGDFRQK